MAYTKELLENLKDKKDKNIVIPNHIAIIMDGNRRWAKSKNLPGNYGHKEGVKTLKKIVQHSSKIGVKYLTVYAFSTENWNRKKEEVSFLMGLIKEVIQNEFEDLNKNNVKLKIIGFIDELPGSLPNDIHKMMDTCKNNTGLNLQVALNYGSRAEITNAIKKIAQDVIEKRINPEDINEDLITKNLLTKDIPDPDLLIRTGGEFRISNYLLWQCAYSEFHSTEVMWPEFNEKELDKAIEEFNARQRRFGV